MKLDSIALQFTSDLDRVYPPMTWVAHWSDGQNIPLGLKAPFELRLLMKIPDFYRRGLWLFSNEGHGHHIPDLCDDATGIEVTAWTRREAEARLRKIIANAH